MTSVVYFVRRESDGLVKIGITKRLRGRMWDLKKMYGDVTLLGTLQGGRLREKLLHLAFADTRVEGEFFEPTPELLGLIKGYAKPKQTPMKTKRVDQPYSLENVLKSMVWQANLHAGVYDEDRQAGRKLPGLDDVEMDNQTRRRLICHLVNEGYFDR